MTTPEILELVKWTVQTAIFAVAIRGRLEQGVSSERLYEILSSEPQESEEDVSGEGLAK